MDSGDARRLAAAFDQAVKVAPEETRKVVQRGAHNIKKDAQRRISGHPHLPHLPNAITYDSEQTARGAQAEIGPDKTRRQGPLGHIPEYGTVNNPPAPYLAPALDAEAPKFRQALEDAATKAIGL